MVSQTEPSRRRGKFRVLVNDFAATAAAHHITMPLAEIEAMLADRIATVAEQAGISEQTALRTYFPDDWGHEAALRLASDRQDQRLFPVVTAAAVPPPVLLRVLAALGQAQLFATINTNPSPGRADARPSTARRDMGPGTEAGVGEHRPRPVRARVPGASLVVYDPTAAAGAITALAMALHEQPAAAMVTVEGRELAAARDTLSVFVDLVDRRRWISCHCCALADQQQLLDELVARLHRDRDDLEHYLRPTSAQPEARAELEGDAVVVPLRRPRHRGR